MKLNQGQNYWLLSNFELEILIDDHAVGRNTVIAEITRDLRHRSTRQ